MGTALIFSRTLALLRLCLDSNAVPTQVSNCFEYSLQNSSNAEIYTVQSRNTRQEMTGGHETWRSAFLGFRTIELQLWMRQESTEQQDVDITNTPLKRVWVFVTVLVVTEFFYDCTTLLLDTFSSQFSSQRSQSVLSLCCCRYFPINLTPKLFLFYSFRNARRIPARATTGLACKLKKHPFLASISAPFWVLRS